MLIHFERRGMIGEDLLGIVCSDKAKMSLFIFGHLKFLKNEYSFGS
jgi:hypothetical protein